MKKAILPILTCLFLLALLSACRASQGGPEGETAPPTDILSERSARLLPTPEPASEPTPTPTPEQSPPPTPEAAPSPTPEPTPEPTPSPTPEATPPPEPAPTPEANGVDGDRSGPEVPSPVRDYVLNTNSMKFHTSDCRSVGQMKEENKSFFTGSREEVLEMGYVPCKICDP